MNSYSTEIKDSIRSYLDSQEWKYAFDEQYGCFYLNISLSGRTCRTKMVISVSDSHYQVSAALVHPVPDETLDDMRKVLNRINNICAVSHYADLIADVRQGRMSAEAAVNVLQTDKARRMN